jgi:hypothetical protein
MRSANRPSAIEAAPRASSSSVRDSISRSQSSAVLEKACRPRDARVDSM